MPNENFYSPRSSAALASASVICSLGFGLTVIITPGFIYAGAWAVPLVFLIFSVTRLATLLILFQIGVPLLMMLAFFLGYVSLYTSSGFPELVSDLDFNSDKVAVFFQMTATLYAIVTGFTLWRAVADFTELDMALRRESNQINSLSCFLDFFDNVDDAGTSRSIRRMRVVLKEYCDDVLAMTATGGTKENETRIRECIALCENLKTPEENDRIALDGLIKGLARLSEIRTERITVAKLNLSPFLSFLLLLLALITVSFFFTFDAREVGLAHVIIPFLAFVHTFIIMMLLDIYYPYGGYWVANAEPFIGVQERLLYDISHK